VVIKFQQILVRGWSPLLLLLAARYRACIRSAHARLRG